MAKVILAVFFGCFFGSCYHADEYDKLVYESIVYRHIENIPQDISVVLNDKYYQLIDNNKITIMFSDGRVSGSSGVNMYIGNYILLKNKISFSEFSTTRMMGSESDMESEREYLHSLQGTKDIRISGNRLFIGGIEFILAE